jgi:hypothetical protein
VDFKARGLLSAPAPKQEVLHRRAVDERTYGVLLGARQHPLERAVRSCTRTWRSQPRQLQHSLPPSGTPTSGNGIRTRSDHASSRSTRSRRPTGRTTTITNLRTTGVGLIHTTCYKPKRPRHPLTITDWSSRHPQLFLPSNSGQHGPHSSNTDSSETNTSQRAPSNHHGPHSRHADRPDPSSSHSAPPGYSAALSERTNQDGHAFLRHSPVFRGHRRRWHLNPLVINQQSCTRIDKPQNRSRDHTCRRSGSNLSYMGIDVLGL